MELKHKPATPLPCRVSKMEGGRKLGVVNALGGLLFYMDARSDGQAEYFVRAANAYPRLVEALREVRLIAEAVDREGDDAVPAAYRAKTLADAVEVSNALLRELGEAE